MLETVSPRSALETTRLLLGSRTRIFVSILMIVTCFIWLTAFFLFVVLPNPRVAPNLTFVWINTVFAVSFLFWGLAVAFKAKIRYAATLYVIGMLWLSGLLLIPVPNDYANEVYGVYFFVLVGLIILYEEFRKNRSRKQPSKTGQ